MPRSNQWRRTLYRERIEKLAPGYDPAHVEAYMIAYNPYIDALSRQRFEREVGLACLHVKTHGIGAADALAKSFGLKPRSLRK